MRGILRKGFREYDFLNSRESRFVEFNDRHDAVMFLQGFSDDQYYMSVLRNLLEREVVGAALYEHSDLQVIEQLADLLVNRQVRVVERFDLFESGFHAVTATIKEIPPPAPMEQFADEPDEVPAPAPPPPPPAANQAQAFKNAAQSGAALCEA